MRLHLWEDSAGSTTNLLSSEISKFGENIKKDHPDAEILISKLSDVTKSLEKIKIDLNIF